MAYKGFQNIQLISHYLQSVSCENSKCLDFLLLKVKQFKKAIVIAWNSLKTRNSLSGEFWVIIYNLSMTHGIILERQGGKCVFRLMTLTKC